MKEVLENAGAENPADFLPVLKWIPINNYEKRVERLGKKADLFLQGLIEDHRNRKDGGDRNTVIDHLLTLQESQPEYYSDQIIKGFVLQWNLKDKVRMDGPCIIM
uniref:Cytochrome P450 n=1 Tax=Cannabis sativa TaxID=3483 RepID=A0A803PSH4_CANSA